MGPETLATSTTNKLNLTLEGILNGKHNRKMHIPLRKTHEVRHKIKLYNDRRNAQVLNLFIHLLLPYMFRGFSSPKHVRQYTVLTA
jgi:hypothetical protein